MIGISVFDGDVRFVEDLAADWPGFVAPGVVCPARAAVVEFRAPQAILSTDHPSLSVWIREVLARLLASEAALPALEIVLNSGVYNEIHKRLGILTTVASQLERGVRVADSATRRGDRLLMGGILELGSAQDVADELAATNGNYGRAFIFFPSSIDPYALLDTLLQSPNVLRVEYFVRFFLPELVSAVLDAGSLVVRIWNQDEISLDVFGRIDVLRSTVLGTASD